MHWTHDLPAPVPTVPTPTNPGFPTAQGQPPTRPLVNYSIAAKVLGVSTRTTRTLVKTGKLPALKIRRRVLIDPADLDKFILDAKAAASPAKGE